HHPSAAARDSARRPTMVRSVQNREPAEHGRDGPGTLGVLPMKTSFQAVLVLVAMALSRCVLAADADARCTALAHVGIDHVTVTVVERNGAGQFEPVERGKKLAAVTGLPKFCRVHGVARPVPGSEIGFEVWLPVQGWNNRLHMLGNASYSSSIYWEQMADRIR